VAVIGPLADDYRVLLGNYHGTSDNLITPLSGIKELLGGSGTRVMYSPGCQITTGIPNLVPLPSQYLLSADSTSNGLSARYFGNRDFSGTPPLNRLMRMSISGGMTKHPLPGKWQMNFLSYGKVIYSPPVTDSYTLGMNACNGVNFYFQDSLRIRFDNVHHPLQQTFSVNLEKGEKYPVKIEF
jgi:beta-glucosidase